MKALEAPPRPDFDIYVARAGTHWALREPGDSLEAIYGRGFLPYSGTEDVQGVFYDARSARVEVEDFALTSENRRIAKKFDGHFRCERVAARQFTADANFYEFCLSYFAQKHGQNAMPRARLKTILQSGLLTDIITYTHAQRPVAYVCEVSEGRMAHYWYSFYDLAFAHQSLGLWLMLDALRQAKELGLKHYYLGTVYGRKALYKTNFEPLEWWDGAVWSRDLAKLKECSLKE